VVVLDPYNPIPPANYAMNYPSVAPQPQQHAKLPVASHAAPPYQAGAFDPDDMELDQDSSPSSGSSTPPETPISTPVSSYPSLSLVQPDGVPAVSAFETRTLVWKKGAAPFATGGFPPARPSGAVAGDGFNSYAGYAGYSSALPGAAAAPPAEDPTPLHTPTDSGPNSPHYSVTPAMLFSPSGTPSGSRHGSPTPLNTNALASSSSLANALASTSSGSMSMPSTPTSTAPRASTTLSRPASSLLLSKPFKCPKLNCNKSYKQANGLKYHIQHGSCNFAPAKEMEEVSAVLASRRGLEGVGPQDANAALESLSESELREVEREAERRLKPFACGIGECQRRYKNMNGLRE
jgi:transcription factor SFP1